MFFNGFENPKLAAIRLLRSQGCCPGNQIEEIVDEPISGELEGLLRYKEELEARVAQQRSKMSDIPCAIEISQEIEELQEIIDGLARENKQRARELQMISKSVTTNTTEMEDDPEEARENERLQSEYNSLMRKLERINDKNTMLVDKLVHL